MDKALIVIRLKSFAYSVGTLIVAALAAVFISDDFAAIVRDHVGSGVSGTIVMLLLTEAVKHVRNLKLLGAARKQFGSRDAVNYVELI